MARIVRVVRRRDLPDHADTALSAPSFRGAGKTTRQYRRQDYVYPDQLAWPGIASLPGLPATGIPLGLSDKGLRAGVPILGPWLEDRTPLKLGRTDRARIRRLRPAADVR
jgi:Asp-tRNA(Asn)/Glu-tRNA(Gln) amidotransferase A subunit family amidase